MMPAAIMQHPMHKQSRPVRPRVFLGGLVALVALSGANVCPAAIQAALYVLGLIAVLQRPISLPQQEGTLVLLATAYIVFIHVLMGKELDGAFRLLRPCFEGLLAAHVLFKWCNIRSIDSATRVLGVFVGLQFLIALLMFANPLGRLEFIESVYNDESYQNAQFAGALLIRGYGLSRHHLFGLPLACGLAAALLLIQASIEVGWRRLMFGALAIAATLLVAVNARIGLTPLLLCYAAGGLLASSYFPRHLLATALMVAMPTIVFGTIYLGDDFSAVVDWLSAGVLQLGSDAGDSTTFGDLQRMTVVQSNLMELILGLGSTCTGDMPCYSDIGIVRAIQEGGLILLLLVMALYLRLCSDAIALFHSTTRLTGSRKRGFKMLLALVMFGTLLAALVKGEAYGANDYSRLLAALAGMGSLAYRNAVISVRQSRRQPQVLPRHVESSS